MSRSGGKEIVRGIKSGDRLAVFSSIPREKKGKVTGLVKIHSGLKDSSWGFDDAERWFGGSDNTSCGSK